MRSKSGLTLTSSRAWTANQGRHAPQRKVRHHGNLNLFYCCCIPCHCQDGCFSVFFLLLCENVQCPHRFSVVICDPSHPLACEHTKYCHVRTVAPDSPLTGHDTARTLPCCCCFLFIFFTEGVKSADLFPDAKLCLY